MFPTGAPLLSLRLACRIVGEVGGLWPIGSSSIGVVLVVVEVVVEVVLAVFVEVDAESCQVWSMTRLLPNGGTASFSTAAESYFGLLQRDGWKTYCAFTCASTAME